MTLAEYRRKRRSDKTGEPATRRSKARPDRPIFVVQLHHASTRHYDFRLQVGSALKSWAVPKGPSLDPTVKRLAAEVEDHPLAYADFEGRIPQGQYGAGQVEIFDRGGWSCTGSPLEQLARGHLQFELFGDRLNGAWDLVRTRQGTRQSQWLLIKRRDAFATAADADDLLAGSATVAGSPRSGRATHETRADDAKGDDVMRLTHAERVVYPDRGATKGDVAGYYIEVMPWLLPEIIDRPLSIIRCVRGLDQACFFQRHHTAGIAEDSSVSMIEESGDRADYLVVRSPEALMELVQFNTIEFHPWGSTASAPDLADRIVFDLDPGPGVPWRALIAAARQVRDALARLSLESFVRTSGGKGLHVVVPLNPGSPWSTVKQFARSVARSLAAAAPDRYVAEASKARREGRIFIDYLRNDRSATSIASYSLRARAGAPVATPLSWAELGRTKGADAFDIGSVPARLRRLKADPWERMQIVRQGLDDLANAQGADTEGMRVAP